MIVFLLCSWGAKGFPDVLEWRGWDGLDTGTFLVEKWKVELRPISYQGGLTLTGVMITILREY